MTRPFYKETDRAIAKNAMTSIQFLHYITTLPWGRAGEKYRAIYEELTTLRSEIKELKERYNENHG